MRITLHAFDELNELRSSHSGVPNGKRHSKLGYLHIGDFVRFTENIALHNSKIPNFGECIAATLLTPFRFNTVQTNFGFRGSELWWWHLLQSEYIRSRQQPTIWLENT
jgi:hypothetical protein